MRSRVVFRPAARAELSDAAAWYRSKSVVVTAAFRRAIRRTINRIAERPRSFAEILPGIHRALTPQFPYAIFFAEEARQSSFSQSSIRHKTLRVGHQALEFNFELQHLHQQSQLIRRRR